MLQSHSDCLQLNTLINDWNLSSYLISYFDITLVWYGIGKGIICVKAFMRSATHVAHTLSILTALTHTVALDQRTYKFMTGWGFLRILESLGFVFIKFQGPEKSWKMSSIQCSGMYLWFELTNVHRKSPVIFCKQNSRNPAGYQILLVIPMSCNEVPYVHYKS